MACSESEGVLNAEPMDVDSRTLKPEKVVYAPAITRSMLSQMQEFIQETKRPHWCTSPPKDFGEKSHGKLKADEISALFTFDVVVAVAQLLVKKTDFEKKTRNFKLFRATILLGTIVRITTSFRTSAWHVEAFQDIMKEYALLLRDLFPEMSLVPNHHMALHLPDLFMRFGPPRAWWAFPFERIIGRLQNIPTNNKAGKF